jgi:hypothetical protein
MPRRRRVGSRFRPMTELELVAAETRLAVGVNSGTHSTCDVEREQAEAELVAALWLELREHVMCETTADLHDHFAYQVLEAGRDPPFEPDPRLPPHDPRQDQYAAHQLRMAGLVREAFERPSDASPTSPWRSLTDAGLRALR